MLKSFYAGAVFCSRSVLFYSLKNGINDELELITYTHVIEAITAHLEFNQCSKCDRCVIIIDYSNFNVVTLVK